MQFKINPKLIQLVGDIIIPTLGYLFWGWGLFFIVLFFLLDLIIREFFFIKKTHKIISVQHFNQSSFKRKFTLFSLGSIGLLLCVLTLSFLIFYKILPKFEFTKELKGFLFYTEFGIPQFILLFPLLYFGGMMQFKREFILPKKYLELKFKPITTAHFKTYVIIILLEILLLTLSFFITFSEGVYVITLLLIYLLYQFFVIRKEIKR